MFLLGVTSVFWFLPLFHSSSQISVCVVSNAITSCNSLSWLFFVFHLGETNGEMMWSLFIDGVQLSAVCFVHVCPLFCVDYVKHDGGFIVVNFISVTVDGELLL